MAGAGALTSFCANGPQKFHGTIVLFDVLKEVLVGVTLAVVGCRVAGTNGPNTLLGFGCGPSRVNAGLTVGCKLDCGKNGDRVGVLEDVFVGAGATVACVVDCGNDGPIRVDTCDLTAVIVVVFGLPLPTNPPY